MPSREKLGTIPVRDEFIQLRAIYDSLQDTIDGIFKRVTPMNYTKARAAKEIRLLKRKIFETNARTMIWAERAAKDAFIIGYERTESTLEAAGFDQEKIVPVEHNPAIDITVDLITADMVKANRTIVKSMKKYFAILGKIDRKVTAKIQEQELSDADWLLVEDIIDAGYISHQARGQVSRKIHQVLIEKIGEGNLIEVIDKNGRTMHFNPKKYAEMVARTRLRELQTQAVKAACKAHECDLVEWSVHDRPCSRCEPYEGRVFSLSGKHPDYPPLDDEPPLHPRCEHNINPATHEERLYREHQTGVMTSGFGGNL